MDMEANRKAWNKQQTEFRRILLAFDQHERAIELFLSQHACLHTADMAGTASWSFEDEVIRDMTETQIRRIPHNCEHSVAWCLWHIARIEDVAMNMLVTGSPQVLQRENWLERMKIEVRDTGNAMNANRVADLSACINIEGLLAYRLAVGRRTREIASQLQPEALKAQVDPSRLQQVLEEGAVIPAAQGLIDYWSRRTIAGLLLMPPTRHNFVHLNEALRLKRRRRG